MFSYFIDIDDKNMENPSSSKCPVKDQPSGYSVCTNKSGLVKRIESIARKRDERRQRFSYEKIMKELNSNLNHPHYDYVQMIDDYRKSLNYHHLNDNNDIIDNQIVVCVRKRPLNERELKKNEIDVVTILTNDQLIVHETKMKVDLTKFLDNHNFRFDYVFDENATNEMVYKFTAQPMVQTIFDGGYATCFAYGQTGAGKTHTMCGEFRGCQQNYRNGIYGLVANDIFRIKSQPSYSDKNLTIFVSFFEIYGKLVFDLLSNKQRLNILEDGRQLVHVVGLTEWQVKQFDDIIDLIKSGTLIRQSGQTTANLYSSRSHAILQITLKQQNHIYGRISLIDLAGNERGADTMKTNRKTQLEGADINRSLLTLKECIRALNRKDKHCPFRESLLTKILRDSLIGDNRRTCMIALISPNICSVEHTLNTLRYADRVKEISIKDHTTDSDYNDDNDDDDKSSSNDNIIDINWNIVDYNRDVMEKLTNFQKLNKILLDNHAKYNRFEFANKWKDILYQMIEENKKAYNKVTQFCKQFDNEM